MVIYIRTQGAQVVKEGRHLLVKKGDSVYHTLFVDKIQQILVFGNVSLTPSARNMVLRHGVDTVFLTKNGRYMGRFANHEPKNVFLRKRQFNLLDDREFGLQFCRRVVAGKLVNMATLLMRIKRTKNVQEAGRKARETRDLLARVEAATGIDELRGLEGRGSALYFAGLRLGFQGDAGFHRRVRRPPTDPVNAVLSLLYTFLFNRVYTAVRVNHLDPYPGFLHVVDYGRHSLVLDLMEEFRSIVADTLTLSLFNLHILQKEDFETRGTTLAREPPEAEALVPDVATDVYGLGAEGLDTDAFDVPVQRMSDAPVDNDADSRALPAVKLKTAAFQRVVENFERKLAAEFYYEPYAKKITLADAIIAQAGQYRKCVEGEMAVYQPLVLK